jgi:hypothetical protein
MTDPTATELASRNRRSATDWITPEWWFGLADYALKLVLIIGAIVVSQWALAAPRVDVSVSEATSESANPLLPATATSRPPGEPLRLDAFRVFVRSTGGTDVKDVVVTPRLQIFEPFVPGSNRMPRLRPGEGFEVIFAVRNPADAPAVEPSMADGELIVSGDDPILLSELVSVNYNHDLAPNQSVVNVAVLSFAVLVILGASTSIWRGRPLSSNAVPRVD